MSENIERVKGLLSSLTDSTKLVRREILDTRNRIRILNEELRELERKPLTKEDFVRICHASVDRNADREEQNLADFMRSEAAGIGFNGVPYFNVFEILRLTQGQDFFPVQRIGTIGHRGVSVISHFTEEASYLFLRDQMKEAISRAAEKITDWPFPDAVPATSFFDRVLAIRQELEQLTDLEKELVSKAESLGISVAKIDTA